MVNVNTDESTGPTQVQQQPEWSPYNPPGMPVPPQPTPPPEPSVPLGGHEIIEPDEPPPVVVSDNGKEYEIPFESWNKLDAQTQRDILDQGLTKGSQLSQERAEKEYKAWQEGQWDQWAAKQKVEFQQKAVDKLKDYRTPIAGTPHGKPEYGYDIAKYLRKGGKVETLKDAGFDDKAIQEAQDFNKQPLSLNDFSRQYYEDNGWKDYGKKEPQITANRGMSPEKYNAQVKANIEWRQHMAEATDAYRREKGNGAWLGSVAGGALSTVFTPAKALAPDITLKEVSGWDWALGSAQAALLVIAPASVLLKGPTGLLVVKGAEAAAGGIFLTDTVKNWGAMSPGERGMSVAFDTLIIGSALPKGAIVNTVKQGAKATGEHIGEAINTARLNPEAGSFRLDPRPAEDLIKAVENRGTPLPSEFRNKLSGALQDFQKAAAVAAETKQYGDLIKATRELEKFAEGIPNPYARLEFQNQIRRIAANPKSVLETVEAISDAGKTADVVKANTKASEQINDILKESQKPNKPPEPKIVEKPPEAKPSEVKPIEGLTDEEAATLNRKPATHQEYLKWREAKNKFDRLQAEKAEAEEAARVAERDRKAIEDLKRSLGSKPKPQGPEPKPSETRPEGMTEEETAILNKKPSTHEEYLKWKEAKAKFDRLEAERAAKEEAARVAERDRQALEELKRNQPQPPEPEAKPSEPKPSRESSVLVKEKTETEVKRDVLTEEEKAQLRKIKEDQALEKMAKELRKEEAKQKALADKKTEEEFKKRQKQREEQEAERKVKEDAAKKKEQQDAKERQDLKRKLSETKPKPKEDIGEINRKIREDMKRIREAKEETQRMLDNNLKEQTELKEKLRTYTEQELRDLRKNELKPENETKLELKTKLATKTKLALKLETKTKLAQELKLKLKQQTKLQTKLQNKLRLNLKLANDLEYKLKRQPPVTVKTKVKEDVITNPPEKVKPPEPPPPEEVIKPQPPEPGGPEPPEPPPPEPPPPGPPEPDKPKPPEPPEKEDKKPRLRIKSEAETKQKEKQPVLAPGSLAWEQGKLDVDKSRPGPETVYKYAEPDSYQIKTVVGVPPKGYRDTGDTPRSTIQTIGGPVKKKISLDMGITRATALPDQKRITFSQNRFPRITPKLRKLR